jgi:hypothetical protein
MARVPKDVVEFGNAGQIFEGALALSLAARSPLWTLNISLGIKKQFT